MTKKDSSERIAPKPSERIAPKPSERIALGQWGEERAVKMLVEKGFTVDSRNWRCRYGEIDIVAWAPDGALCFIEVRTSRGKRFGGAAQSITARKRRRMLRSAQTYLSLSPVDAPTRFDVIVNQWAGGHWETDHFMNAFLVET